MSDTTKADAGPRVVRFEDVTPEQIDSIAASTIETLEDLSSRIQSGPADWIDQQSDAEIVESVIGVLELLRFHAMRVQPTPSSWVVSPMDETPND